MPKNLSLSVKVLGKKHSGLESIPFQLSSGFSESPTLRDLLEELVHQQVTQFNAAREGEQLLPYLSKQTISEQVDHGKVGFGSIYNQETIELTGAVSTALQAFEDGLYFVFINKNKIEKLNESIELNDNTEILFLRLVALVGGYF